MSYAWSAHRESCVIIILLLRSLKALHQVWAELLGKNSYGMKTSIVLIFYPFWHYKTLQALRAMLDVLCKVSELIWRTVNTIARIRNFEYKPRGLSLFQVVEPWERVKWCLDLEERHPRQALRVLFLSNPRVIV